MKIRSLSLACAVMPFFASSASAATLVTESFEYASGALLEENGWTIVSGSTLKQTAISPGLVYPGLPSAGLSTGLSHVASGASGQDIGRPFDSQTTGTVYTSFLISLSGGPITSTTGDYPVHMQQTGAGAFFSRFTVRSDGSGGLNFGIRKESTGTTAFDTGIRTYDTTYLIVMAYEFVDGAANDISSLWINPAVTELAPAPLLTTTSGVDATGLERVNLRQTGGTGLAHANVIDEIRVATTWAEAVGIPEPSSSMLAMAAGLGLMRRRR